MKTLMASNQVNPERVPNMGDQTNNSKVCHIIKKKKKKILIKKMYHSGRAIHNEDETTTCKTVVLD